MTCPYNGAHGAVHLLTDELRMLVFLTSVPEELVAAAGSGQCLRSLRVVRLAIAKVS